MHTCRERLIPFLEILRSFVFAYVNQSFFDSGLPHMPRFGQRALTSDMQGGWTSACVSGLGLLENSFLRACSHTIRNVGLNHERQSGESFGGLGAVLDIAAEGSCMNNILVTGESPAEPCQNPNKQNSAQ